LGRSAKVGKKSLLVGDEWSSAHYRCFNLAEKASGIPKQGA